MLKAEKYLNSTYVDEKGLVYSLTREKTESLTDFQKRIYNSFKHEPLFNKESFYNSLDYLFAGRDKQIARVTCEEPLKTQIEITSKFLRIFYNNEIIKEIDLYEYKFLKYLLEELSNVEKISIEILEGENDYLLSKNLIPMNNKKYYKDFSGNGRKIDLPKQYPSNVQDDTGLFEKHLYDDEELEETEINLEGNKLSKGFEGNLEMSFTYMDWPITIRWNQIKACPVNDKDFEKILKKDLILNQKGAKIIDKILTKQNTYWGK